MVIVGLPESNLPALRPQSLFGKSLTGSLVGSPKDIEEMLQVAVKHNVRPWIETRPMHEVAKTVQGECHLSPFVCTDLQADTAPPPLKDMHEGKARYRFVLMNPV
jgi:alcohol dehydrogenase (NADP+)